MAREQWEYHHVMYEGGNENYTLLARIDFNKLGENQWELVSVCKVSEKKCVAWFKRETKYP